jgi:hypothetical protein
MKTHRKRIVEGLPSASEASGIPVDVLKRMKALGCDAFEPGNRIDWKKAKAWFAIPENAERVTITGDNLSLKDQKLNEEVRRLRRNNDRDDKILMQRSEHESEIRQMAEAAMGVLYPRIDSLSVATAGQPAVKNHALITAWVDEAVGKLSRGEKV